jgi:hypothetical protein
VTDEWIDAIFAPLPEWQRRMETAMTYETILVETAARHADHAQPPAGAQRAQRRCWPI